MTYQTFMQWAGAIGLVLGILNAAWMLAGRASKPLTDKLDGIDSKLDKYRADLVDHDRRIQSVESDLKHMPTRKEITDLALTTTALGGNVNRLDDAVVALTHTVRRIDDYLRDEKP